MHEQLESSGFDDDGRPSRAGTVWSCVAHIITGVIGSGVLSLSWTTSQLGWVAGPGSIICFAVVTYITSCLLADCYRSPDPITGKRNYTYADAVGVYLGQARKWICCSLQCVSMYVTGVVYVITTATSMRQIHSSYQTETGTTHEDRVYMMLFGVVQVMMSQIPDFHDMVWLSILAALMSFSYSFIGFGLSFAKVIDNGGMMGSITGVPANTPADRMFNIFTAIADNAFAYPYSLILIEIQDTLRSPPPENKTMKKASIIAICVTTFFYITCSIFGYGAFGNNTPGNLLLGFQEPHWLVSFANACIIVHLIGGYQVYSQPVFALVEGWLGTSPESKFIVRICFRTMYVVSTVVFGILFPYFNSVLGVLGALNFWPLAIYFPVEMYFARTKNGTWTRKGMFLQILSFVCFIVSAVGLIGSLRGIFTGK